MQKIDFGFLGSTYIYPNLGFRTYRQHNALILSVVTLPFKIDKIPVYGASPWIDSLAHTVQDEIP